MLLAHHFFLFCLLLHACFAAEEDSLQVLEGNIKSCLGEHCSSFQRDDGVIRIGLLSPPKSGAEIIWSILQHVKDAGGFKPSNKKQQKGSVDVISSGHEPQLILGDGIVLVLSTHVPPYGYGRNHGWSKIVRLYTDVVDHTLSILPMTTDPAMLDAQARLLVRWHCRLSHVAAHTKMLSIFSDNLAKRPMVVLEQLLSFVGVSVDRKLLARIIAQHLPALRNITATSTTTATSTHTTPSSMIMNKNKDNQETTRPGMSIEMVRSTIRTAVAADLLSSDNMQRWPCHTFQSIYHSLSSSSTTLPTMRKKKTVQQTESSSHHPHPSILQLPYPYHVYTANCSDPMVTCSVKYDLIP